jgi:hypothetical protein
MERNFILQKLNPFLNKSKVITKNQGTEDIINGILNTSIQYQSEYDKIAPYFYTGDVYTTCQNVWNFIKKNIKYKIESDKYQTLRSPSAILSGIPSDCKSMSLMGYGLIKSLINSGCLDCDVAFRFAGYNDAKEFQHVFVVVTCDGKEIWIDAVLPTFNNREKKPNIYSDKNTNMSLIALSGVGDTSYQVQKQSDLLKQNYVGAFTDTLNSIDKTITNATPVVSSVLDAIKMLSSLVKTDHGTINDWQGWNAQMDARGLPHGTPANYLAKYDGDAGVQIEAVNMIQWIANNSLNEVLGYNAWNKQTVTIDDVVSKITRGGYPKEAQALKNAYLGISTPTINPQTGMPTTGTKTAGMNIFVTLALVGAGIYAISKMAK